MDAAFWDKYQQVAAGNELAVSRCLGGDLAGPVQAKGSSGSREKAPGPGGSAAPVAEQFTLQLGVFSAEKNAQAFIKQNSLAGKARVQRRRKGDTDQYLVLYGSYATQSEAKTAQQGLARLQPWVRRVGDL